MKELNKVSVIILVLVLTLIGCKNEETKKVDLVYENGIEKIVVEIENGKDYLIYDQPTKANFVCTNIDPISLIVSGPGIKLLGTKNKTTMRTEINVPSDYLEKDTLTIKIRFGKNRKKEHQFNIPMKKSE